MPERNAVERTLLAALEREPVINLHHSRIHPEFDPARGLLTLDGEVVSIAAKKRAFAVASGLRGVTGVMDRLCVTPAERRGDGAIRAALGDALLIEPVYRGCAIRVWRKGALESLRDPSGADGAIELAVEEGVVRLHGTAPSLEHKQLAGVMAWWSPGVRDVLNELVVTPPEAETDGELSDALRLALEKDPLIPHADDIGIRVRDHAVMLSGAVATEEERRMAEYDAWFLVGVREVDNQLVVRR
jgi:osmotically-inducible protein OsmY